MIQRNSSPETTGGRTGLAWPVGWTRGLPLPTGAVFGALAFVVGYLLTVLLTAVAGGLIGSRDPLALSGLVFYGAHFVVGAVDWPTGAQAMYALDEISSTIPKLVYYLVPVGVLTGTGYLLVNRLPQRDSLTPRSGAKAGMSIVVGYLPLVVVGALLISTRVVSATTFESAFWRVNLVSAVVLAGLVYPLALGALGGYLAVRSPSERVATED